MPMPSLAEGHWLVRGPLCLFLKGSLGFSELFLVKNKEKEGNLEKLRPSISISRITEFIAIN